jgi:bisphosphoglycerate-independent phosphoglycerate mutase (AlkP superfamily)
MVVNGGAVVLKNGGTLANVAPTILKFLGIPKPVEMTAEPLCDIIP